MGVETSAGHGGAETSFTLATIAIEQLAKVDPSLSVLCDVHVRKHHDPQLRCTGTTGEVVASARSVKGSSSLRVWSMTRPLTCFIAWQLLLVRAGLRFRRVRSSNTYHEGWGH